MEASISLCREAARPLCIICWWLRFGEGVTWSSAVSCCTRWQIHVAFWPLWSLLFPRSSLRWLFCLFSLICFYLTVKSISFDCKGHFNSADLSSDVWVWFGRLHKPSVAVMPCPTWSPHLSAAFNRAPAASHPDSASCYPAPQVRCVMGTQNCAKKTVVAKVNSQRLALWWWRGFYLGLPTESCVHRGLQDWGDKPWQLE